MKKALIRALYLVPLFVVSRAHAQVSIDFPMSFAGFSSQDLKSTIENIIRIILGFLGIVTIIIILYGGFIWMSSFGEEDKIDQAKKLISAGVVGLVIVLAAYALSSFVINSLTGAL